MAYCMLVIVLCMASFALHSLITGKRKLIHRLYVGISSLLILWLLGLLGMKLVGLDDKGALFVLDAITNVAASLLSATLLVMALVFSRNLHALPKKYGLFYLIPLYTTVMVFTNPWHHLHYTNFSILASEVRFGPSMYVSSLLSYACIIGSLGVFLYSGFRSGRRARRNQALIFSLGTLVPMVVNLVATLQIVNLSIAATPLAFAFTVCCHAVAIYYLGFLDLKPLATQRVLDSISDRYIVLSDDCTVVSFNKPFFEVLGKPSGIRQGRQLREFLTQADNQNRSFLYNLITAAESCGRERTGISYEQALLRDGATMYFVAEVTPLFLTSGEPGGYVAIFKDITRLRESLQNEQRDLARTMERERLASLGQMIGGISHNLKTPIMSVSGSVNMLYKLTEEYRRSAGDQEVTPEDHLEIADEMESWLKKIEDCCAYMSDIITTVKGLATNLNTSDEGEFTVDELFKRVLLLMKHDLVRGKCALNEQNELPPGSSISGDINSLVQVLNNLVANAVDAMPDGGDIDMRAERRENALVLSVADRGAGLPADVRNKLFREMVTSKGALGTGLGLYISAEIIRGRFGGQLSFTDRDGGGTVFEITLPLE